MEFLDVNAKQLQPSFEKFLIHSAIIADKILSLLDAKSLALLGSTSQKLRNLTNSNHLWHKLCIQNNFVKYECLLELPSHISITTKSTNLPVYVPPESAIKENLCKWRLIFNRAQHLENNWTKGVYFVAPVLKGHKGAVSSFDSNGTFALSSSNNDKLIKVWNVQDLECINTFKAKSDSVNSIKLYKDLIITSDDEGSIKIYDKFEGDLKYTMSSSSTGSANHILIIEDKIAVSYSDKSIRIWSLVSHLIVHILRGHEDEIEYLTSSKSYHNIIISGSWDKTIILWDVTSGSKLINLIGHTEVINSIKMIDDRCVSASSDSKLIIWDLKISNNEKSKKKITINQFDFQLLSGHNSDVYCLDVNKDYIASGGADSLIILWSYLTGELLYKLTGHLGIVRFLFLDDKKLVSGGDSKKIIVWNYKDGKLSNILYRNPTKLHFMYKDETKIITASQEGEANITVICFW